MRDCLDIEIEKKKLENNNLTSTPEIVVENKPVNAETTLIELKPIINLNDQVIENQTTVTSSDNTNNNENGKNLEIIYNSPKIEESTSTTTIQENQNVETKEEIIS